MSNAQTTAAIAVRRLTKADLDRVVEIDQDNTGRSRRGFFQNRLAVSLAEPAGFISLAFLEDDIVQGFALAHMLDGEFGGRHPVAVLDAIGVTPAARGHGGAHALMRELQVAARGRGAHSLRTQIAWKDESIMHFVRGAGFDLGSRLVLGRNCAKQNGEARAGEISEGQDFSEDRISIRSLTQADLPAIVRIDREITGRDRSLYFKRKVNEALRGNGVRMSMVAEIDGAPAGFVMARVDYGEFGQAESEAVLDTIGIDEEFAGQHVGTMLLMQLLWQLDTLNVDHVRTIVEWNNASLIAFLDRMGFKPTQNMTFSLAL